MKSATELVGFFVIGLAFALTHGCSGAGKPQNVECQEAKDCATDQPCTLFDCSNGECQHEASPDGTVCDDRDPCTTEDRCAAQACLGRPIDCDDLDACNGTETCVDGQCAAGIPMDCDDLDLCNGTETCTDGQCQAGTPLDCEDQNPCTSDTCSPGTGCAHANEPDGTACDPQMWCQSGACVAQDPCGVPDLSVPYPYALSGYWSFGALNACDWRQKLTRMHKVGADTVVQFGPRLDWGNAATMPACTRDGKNCFQAALDDLTAAHAGNSIEAVYAYHSVEDFGPVLLACPSMDQRIEVDGRLYFSLLLPHADPSDRSCNFAQGRAYDLVLIEGRQPNDSVRQLLEQAAIMNMQVFVGLPAPALDPVDTWDVSTYARATALELSKRILSDYAVRYADMPAWQGVYQGMEAMLGSTPNGVLTWYDDQHAQVRSILPGKQILISPYWIARAADGTSVAVTSQGVRDLAQRTVDIIAPQDGVGTAKSFLFWPFEDSGGYLATTADYYRGAREALDALNNGVRLWVNLESFAPGVGPCYPDLNQTSKERLDKAVMFDGNLAEKVISYKWENLICDGGLGQLLIEQIEADWQRPIISQAFRWDVGGQPGIALRGYHIASGQVLLTYYDPAWQAHNLSVSTDSGIVDPDYGANDADQPDLLQEVWIPFHWDNLAPGFWVHIGFSSPAGTSHHNYSLGY